jgi:L-serine---[L-seryl-carrier protein] ligase
VTATETGQKHGGAGWRGVDGFAYIRPIRTTGDRPPLICFFPGEPGARGLAESLPDNQPIYEFSQPNMDGVSIFPTVEELAATFLEDVLTVQAKGPYQLCTHHCFDSNSFFSGH